MFFSIIDQSANLCPSNRRQDDLVSNETRRRRSLSVELPKPLAARKRTNSRKRNDSRPRARAFRRIYLRESRFGMLI